MLPTCRLAEALSSGYTRLCVRMAFRLVREDGIAHPSSLMWYGTMGSRHGSQLAVVAIQVVVGACVKGVVR